MSLVPVFTGQKIKPVKQLPCAADIKRAAHAVIDTHDPYQLIIDAMIRAQYESADHMALVLRQALKREISAISDDLLLARFVHDFVFHTATDIAKANGDL